MHLRMILRAPAVLLGCAIATTLACRTRDATQPSAPLAGAGAPRAAPPAPAEERWGIRPLSVRPASGGYLVAFRYRVTDAGKARALFDEKLKPVLVDHETGASLAMPEDTKLGALRSSPRTRPEDGKQYFVLFRNDARAVKRGSRVDVVMGGCRLEDLVVE